MFQFQRTHFMQLVRDLNHDSNQDLPLTGKNKKRKKKGNNRPLTGVTDTMKGFDMNFQEISNKNIFDSDDEVEKKHRNELDTLIRSANVNSHKTFKKFNEISPESIYQVK